jgi:hypothetical protein
MATRRVVGTIESVRSQHAVIRATGRPRAAHASLRPLTEIVDIALYCYVSCFATQDGLTPAVLSHYGHRYLIHDDELRLEYPQYPDGKKYRPDRTSPTAIRPLLLRQRKVYIPDAIPASHAALVTERKGNLTLPFPFTLLIECDGHSTAEFAEAALMRGQSADIHDLILNTGSDKIRVPTPFMRWCQTDSFKTLWVLTRWRSEETGAVLPDPIRGYIVHLVRDAEQPYEGCLYCNM